MIDTVFAKQAELLLRIIPLIDRERTFALKGGTAINFFVRDLPRISVDIDLTYLPIGERYVALREISDALARIAQAVESAVPGANVMPKKSGGIDLVSGRFVRRQDATVKIEPNSVIRGSVFPPERQVISPRARGWFEISVECQILSEDELYAGKICAALDRQHPRDLFDIMVLLRFGKFGTAMRKAFIVYLISHDRPMVEILNPNFGDIRAVFETEFEGMTMEEVACEDLEKTREELVAMVARELIVEEKQFIVSVKEGGPRWDLIGIEGIENLPAVKWKLVNISRMSQVKHKQAIRKLKDYLEV
ncbi:MAG: nucleotidyl transferase AbiEii/AbiGii toxin family protein [Candidatus Altiarchaeota archaeon]|nr:nucleotidyl transferase AbiEii/AbiGii toxin family protein [Candidatus Altiarchaeota archaeon]